MLKRPFNLIHSIDSNNYYTLKTTDVTFLVTETILKYKRLLRVKEFTTAIKMLPLNSPVLMTIIEFSKLPKLREEDKGGLEPESIYEILDVKNVRKKLKEIVDELNVENHPFNYNKPIHNETIKNLSLEGYELLTTETIGTYMRKQWLTRSDKNGVLRFVEVTLGGKPTSERVIDIKFHTLNKPIVEDLLIQLEREGE
jgi:hypothetical protein